jgi:DNA-binding CsgD family transcriptional regulator
MAISAEQIKQVIELRRNGKSFAEIAIQAGINNPSTVKNIWYTQKPKGMKMKPQSSASMHYLTPHETKDVKSLTMAGKHAGEIAKELNLSIYNVRKAQKTSGVNPGRGWHPTKKAHTNGQGGARRIKRTDGKLDKRVFKLKEKGKTLVEIAAKLALPRGTVSSAYYRYMKKNGLSNQSKGEELNNGNNAPRNTNGTAAANHKGWTKQNLEGAFASEVIKLSEEYGHAHNYQGVGLTPEALRRRVSELLAS